MIVPINNLPCMQGFQVWRFWWFFNIGRICSVLKSADTWSANLSYLCWLNDFAVLFTEKSKSWNLLVSLRDTISRHHSCFHHTILSMCHYLTLWRCPLLLKNTILTSKKNNYSVLFDIFQVGNNYLFEKFHIFYCVRPMILCECYRKGGS